MIKKIIFLIFTIFSSASYIYAQKAPTSFNSYDGMAVSARSIAMGGAGVAMTGGIDNIFYNSAGLAYIQGDSIQVEALFSLSRQSNISSDTLNALEPINLGFNSFVILQEQGAISWRTLSYNVKFSSGTDYWSRETENIKAITISGSQKSQNNDYAVGIGLSYLYGTLAESSVISGNPFAQTSSGNGFAIDIGFSAPVHNNITFGVNLENVLGFMWWSDYDSEQLPFGIRTGLGYQVGGFTMLADLNKKFYRFADVNDTIYSIGLEQNITRVLVVRLGRQGPSFSNEDNIKYTYGFALNISTFSFSFANESYKINDENVSKYIISLRTVI
ncbi:MAG: hypothetical protein PHR82_02795 [Endomicrobiaceae bacterium]|nr:hypothetical protein [Endomicrobiaceae bacterium]